MSLYTVTDGVSTEHALDVNQYFNLLTGAMTDQPVTIGNILTLTNALKIPGSAGGVVAPTNYGTVPVKIAEYVADGTTASFSFSGIPQVYSSLVFVAKLRHNAGVTQSNVGLRFNNDSTSPHYFSQSWFGINSAPSYFNTTDQSQLLQALMSAGTTNNDFAANLLLIPGYAQSDAVHNTLQLQTHFQTLAFNGGSWTPASPTAITSIASVALSGNFVIGSAVRLYGLP